MDCQLKKYTYLMRSKPRNLFQPQPAEPLRRLFQNEKVSSGISTARILSHQYSGLIQIRKYAEGRNEEDLLTIFDQISAKTKEVREEIHRLLVQDFAYFE